MTKKIGAHVSASGGIDQAIKRAADLDGNCLQIFSGSPRVWAKKKLDQQPIDLFLSQQKKHQISPVFIHALYLINLASDKKILLQKSTNSLIYDLNLDAALQGSGVIVHAGSHTGRGWENVRDELVKILQKILQQSPSNSTLLLENSAGQKGKLFSNLKDLAWIFDKLAKFTKQNKLGWCLDTCHAWAAGYQLSESSDSKSNPQQKNSQLQNLPETISSLDLWPSLKCIHVNDSRDPLGSGRDRHENIGDGTINAEQLKNFLNLPELEKIPFITEVPGLKGQGPDKENIDRIKRLLD